MHNLWHYSLFSSFFFFISFFEYVMTHWVLFEVRSPQARAAGARGSMPYASGAMHTTHTATDACCAAQTQRETHKEVIKYNTSATLQVVSAKHWSHWVQKYTCVITITTNQRCKSPEESRTEFIYSIPTEWWWASVVLHYSDWLGIIMMWCDLCFSAV